MKTVLALTLLLAATAYAQQEPCVQGHEYNDGCNTCICSATGLYACTRMLCSPSPPAHVSKRSAGCDKGEFYYDGCNRCVCQGEIYACTLKACFDGPQFPDTVQLPQPSKATISKRSDGCDKGDSYSDGCNTCVCAGTTYACTARACLPPPPPAEQASHSIQKRSDGCDKGESYYDGCNTCVCSNGAYACTERACVDIPQFPDTKVTPKKVEKRSDGCDKGKSYFDGCNTCTCLNGIYACTLRECYEGPQFPDTVHAEEATTLHPGCDKGHLYMDDCNTCVCSGGKYACTLMGCYHGPQFPDTVTEKVHALKKRSDGCDKGESYYDGCNTCVCSNGAYACTERACIDLPKFPDTEATTLHPSCDKGESYFDGCNRCTCTTIGVYACTKKFCITLPKPEESRKRREVEVSTGKYDLPKKSPLKFLRFDVGRCEPNATRNQSCNICKCTKIGKGWLCTQNTCTSSKQK